MKKGDWGLRNKWIVFVPDVLTILLAYLLTSLFVGWEQENGFPNTGNLLCILCVYLFVFGFTYVGMPMFKRDMWKNLKIVLRYVAAITLVLLGVSLWGSAGYRMSIPGVWLYALMLTVLMMVGRQITTGICRSYYKKPEHRERLVVICNEENAFAQMNEFGQARWIDYEVVGIVIWKVHGSYYYKLERHQEQTLKNKSYLGDRKGDVEDFLKKEAIDEAFLSLPTTSRGEVQELVNTLDTMGINVHLAIEPMSVEADAVSTSMFGYAHVLTYAPREFGDVELALKRLMDIAGGLVGCLLCVVVGIFVCPAIYLEDPGPVVFKQKRVGRNGRQFEIYKFRSMYQDAEERKKELMQQNEMNGLMFKMKNDPRITKVGNFIRKTSLDEFPQFLNVLKGDMSLVGTRPPTVNEFNEYSPHHKRRLSLKPGITGMWQVSGRSEITDFEEVVALDVKYIQSWSIWLDIKILFQTVWVVLARKGSG